MLCCEFVERGVKYVVLPLVFFYFLLAISRDPGDREPSQQDPKSNLDVTNGMPPQILLNEPRPNFVDPP